MSFRPDHELHRRRFSRNAGVGLSLIFFVLLVFGMTIVKVKVGNDLAEKAGQPQPGAALLGMSNGGAVKP